MQLFLEALDVWLFRDGRPFDARSDHRAVSLFPPYPTVIQGAIRSHHLVVKGVDLRDPGQIASTVGTSDNYGPLRLRGPFLAKREHGKVVRYLPVPAHVTPAPDGPGALLPQEPPKTVRISAPTPMLLWPQSEPQKGEIGRWVREDALLTFLRAQPQPLQTEPDSQFFTYESRMGIARNDASRTTEEGALYEVEFIRLLPDVGLLVEVEGYEGWPPFGVMRIGGEGRAARFEQVRDQPIPSPSMGEGKGGGERKDAQLSSAGVSPWPPPPERLPPRFLVYFATPAYFANGWLPKRWEKFFESEVRLQAAALNRFQSLGGFDWATNNHKPARRYVPAGAVYFFASDGRARLRPNLVQNAITDFGAEIGFGQILIGEW